MPSAARIGDMHTCPMVDPGPVSHVGGPIITGSQKAITGNMPQARVTDKLTCVGPPDMIAKGSPTVQVNKLMAARITDLTLHGGVIVKGFPSVLIGEAATCFPGSVDPLLDMTFTIHPDNTVTGTYGPNIVVRGNNPEFVSLTLGHLTALSALQSGRTVINSLSRPVTIMECAVGDDSADTVPSGNWNNPHLYDGTGTDAVVDHYPDVQTVYDGSESWMSFAPHITLGHELTHASHITNGDVTGNPTSGPPIPNDTSGFPLGRAMEERRTVGCGPDPTYGMPDYSGEPYSENTFRRDNDLPLRSRYTETEW
jgi:uncharacterized Zn-binding protein involved in type VI secretion